MPDNRYWTLGAFVGNAWEAGKGLKQGLTCRCRNGWEKAAISTIA